MTKRLLLPAALLVLTSACDDDPFLVRWEISPEEAVLYALDRGVVNEPSAFDLLTESIVIVEDPRIDGDWDFAVDRLGGQMVLLPPSVLGVTESGVGIAPMPGMAFAEVTRAPSDSLLYVDDEPVPIDLGTVYVVRTHEQRGSFSRTCVYYGKVQALEIDAAAGVVRFLHDTSPDCNNRSLIPPD